MFPCALEHCPSPAPTFLLLGSFLSLAYEGQSSHGHTLGMGINTLPMGGGRMFWCVHVPGKPLMPMALHSGSEVDSVALSRPAASSFSCFVLCMWGRHETPSSWVTTFGPRMSVGALPMANGLVLVLFACG